jgi:hypothetical protein
VPVSAAVGVVATAVAVAVGVRGPGVRDEARSGDRAVTARARAVAPVMRAVARPVSRPLSRPVSPAGAGATAAVPPARAPAGASGGRRDSAAGAVVASAEATAFTVDVVPPALATPATPAPLRAATLAPTLTARLGREGLGTAADVGARRRARAAEAGVAVAFTQLVEAMRQSAGRGWEPRAVQDLVAEQRRWEADQRGWVCGVARDPACLTDRAARRAAALEVRRRRFRVDGPPGPDADPATPRHARARRRQ